MRVCRDAITRKSLGYSYVNFSTVAEGASIIFAHIHAYAVSSPNGHFAAGFAMKELNYTALPGATAPMRIMWVQRDPTSRRAAVGNVVVKNLPPTGIDAKTISDLFGAFGAVVSVRLPVDDAGKSKGYGFVQFDTDAAAKACITDLTGMELAGRSIVVEPYVRFQDRQKGCVISCTLGLYLPLLCVSPLPQGLDELLR